MSEQNAVLLVEDTATVVVSGGLVQSGTTGIRIFNSASVIVKGGTVSISGNTYAIMNQLGETGSVLITDGAVKNILTNYETYCVNVRAGAVYYSGGDVANGGIQTYSAPAKAIILAAIHKKPNSRHQTLMKAFRGEIDIVHQTYPPQDFGRHVKEYRNKHNLTERQFAKLAGINYQAVIDWEKHCKIPKVTLYRKVVRNIPELLSKKI